MSAPVDRFFVSKPSPFFFVAAFLSQVLKTSGCCATEQRRTADFGPKDHVPAKCHGTCWRPFISDILGMLFVCENGFLGQK